MKAMIFTGGMESSTHPKKSESPRALTLINGEPLLGMLIMRLADSGFNEIIINVHHFASILRDYIEGKKFGGIRLEISDESDLILDSGGGLSKVAWFFDDERPFLVYNLEVLSDIDLGLLYRFHTRSDALATLVVRNRECERYMLFNERMELCGWENTETGESVKSRPLNGLFRSLSFSRIQLINPLIFSMITEKGAFSLAELYLRLASSNIIMGYLDDDSIWMDLAKKEGLIEAEKLFLKN